MSDTAELNKAQLDALKEVATIGSGHAALALNQMIGEKVNIGVVKVAVIPSENFDKIVGGPETLGAAVYIHMLGDLTGGIILFFKRQDALRLVDTLFHKEKGRTAMLSELGISALKEAGNILTGSYLSTLTQMVRFTMALSVPKFAFDLIGSVMTDVVEEIMQPQKKPLAIVTEFIESRIQIKGYFVFMPKKESLEKILKGLKV